MGWNSNFDPTISPRIAPIIFSFPLCIFNHEFSSFGKFRSIQLENKTSIPHTPGQKCYCLHMCQDYPDDNPTSGRKSARSLQDGSRQRECRIMVWSADSSPRENKLTAAPTNRLLRLRFGAMAFHGSRSATAPQIHSLRTNLTEFTPVLPDERFNGQCATCYCNLRNLKITIEKRLSFFILSRFKNCLYALYKAI